jgi:hypothetical protein
MDLIYLHNLINLSNVSNLSNLVGINWYVVNWIFDTRSIFATKFM